MLIRLSVACFAEESPSEGTYNLHKDVAFDVVPRIGDEVWIDDQLLRVTRIIHTPILREAYWRPQIQLFFEKIERNNLDYLRQVVGWVDSNEEADASLT